MSIERLLHMVDEFGRAMHDSGKRLGSIPPAMLNLERERLRDAIKALAAGKLDEHFAAWHQVNRAMTEPPEPPPVDRNARTLTDGSPVTPDHREINPASGQQKGYVVLSADERANGFVRPYRDAYVHMACKKPATPPNITITTMGRSIAETYARDPGFYSGTFCVHCRGHHPLAEFRWYEMDGTIGPVVGS